MSSSISLGGGIETASLTTINRPYIYRPFVPTDQPAVRSLVLSGLAERFGDATNDTMNPDLNDIQCNYIDRGALVLVVEKEVVEQYGDQVKVVVVGTGTLAVERASVGRIVRMSVVPGSRGKGIGRQLVASLMAEAKRRGYEKVCVETNDDWLDAIVLYLRNGFQEIGRWNGEVHFEISIVPDGHNK